MGKKPDHSQAMTNMDLNRLCNILLSMIDPDCHDTATPAAKKISNEVYVQHHTFSRRSKMSSSRTFDAVAVCRPRVEYQAVATVLFMADEFCLYGATVFHCVRSSAISTCLAASS
eukprot:553080-Amphidinium_carterae.2